MNLADFDFDLPVGRIAQHPVTPRDAARLLVLDRPGGSVSHRRFGDLPDLLGPGDLLVLNDTRVIPARLRGRKPGGGRIEILLEEPAAHAGADVWRCLVRGAGKLGADVRLDLGSGLGARLGARAGGARLVHFESAGAPVGELLDRLGEVPLPPYIRRPPAGPTAEDRERYQTVYARRPGAVAAPTAGLHFTPATFARLARAGVRAAFVTLHVGSGTFAPVREDDPERHRMHPERYELPEAAARAIGETRRAGRRVIAVGTTVARVLETRARPDGTAAAGTGRSELFIRPGFEFKVVDAVVTNFHLPRSTLLMLVAAFAGREAVLAAYREALAMDYRFYSYGDAMLVWTP